MAEEGSDPAVPDVGLSRTARGAMMAAFGLLVLIPGLLLITNGLKAIQHQQYTTLVVGVVLCLVSVVALVLSAVLYSCTKDKAPICSKSTKCCGCPKNTATDQQPIYAVDINVMDMYMPTVNDDLDPDTHSQYVQNSGLPNMDLQPTFCNGIPLQEGSILHVNGTLSEAPRSRSLDPVVLRVNYEGLSV